MSLADKISLLNKTTSRLNKEQDQNRARKQLLEEQLSEAAEAIKSKYGVKLPTIDKSAEFKKALELALQKEQARLEEEIERAELVHSYIEAGQIEKVHQLLNYSPAVESEGTEDLEEEESAEGVVTPKSVVSDDYEDDLEPLDSSKGKSRFKPSEDDGEDEEPIKPVRRGVLPTLSDDIEEEETPTKAESKPIFAHFEADENDLPDSVKAAPKKAKARFSFEQVDEEEEEVIPLPRRPKTKVETSDFDMGSVSLSDLDSVAAEKETSSVPTMKVKRGVRTPNIRVSEDDDTVVVDNSSSDSTSERRIRKAKYNF